MIFFKLIKHMSHEELKYQLLYYSIISNGNYDKISKHIWNNTKINRSIVDDFLQNDKSKFITILDSEYPISLKKISRPPYVIYYQGNIKLLNKHQNIYMLHLTATQPTLWTKHRIKRKFLLVDQFKTIVIQTINYLYSPYTIETCIKNNLNTILILNCGINNYLREFSYLKKYLKKHGLIISQFPNYLKTNKQMLLETNKIMAGLSKELYVYELDKNFYNNNLINNFISINKQIYCMYNLFYPKAYTNNLIKEGADKFY